MRILDLSRPIDAAMPAWPGTPQPEFSEICTIIVDGFAEKRLCFSSHTGTHIDAPAHMIVGGVTLDKLTPDRFFGKALLVDLRCIGGGVIGIDMLLERVPQITEAEFLLLNTGWSQHWGSDAYDSGFPVLSTDAARWLADSGLKGAGIDASSFDAADSHDYPVHRMLLGAGKLLIENLAGLDQLDQHDQLGENGEFWLSVLPLPIAGAEACPVRAVAIIFP